MHYTSIHRYFDHFHLGPTTSNPPENKPNWQQLKFYYWQPKKIISTIMYNL